MSKEQKDFKITLPSMGEGVIEATVNKWLITGGQEVKKDEALLEVSTDKVDTEIMSPHSGFLIKTFVGEGDVVRVDSLIAQISSIKEAKVVFVQEESNSAGNEKADKGARSVKNQVRQDFSPAGFQRSTDKELAGSVASSPLVRKMAKEFNVKLSELVGTGKFGRVTKQDLISYLDENSKSSQKRESSLEGLQTEMKEGFEYLEGVQVKRESMTKIRELTAKHMLSSVKTSPHVTTTFEVCLDSALKFKKEKSQIFEKDFGIKLTLTPLFIEACVLALKKYPYVNGSLDGFDILLKEDINIACAVATDAGLFVPVLKKLQDKNLNEIVKNFQELVTKTRDKKLAPTDLKGGTFSVTNPGMYGSLHSQPIINQPQVAILSVGSIVERCVLVEEKLKNKSFCQIGLTFDHRIIDGQGAAFFLQVVKKRLESFS